MLRMTGHSAVEFENGDWCGTPLHQFRNYTVTMSEGTVPRERVMAIAKKHGAACFHTVPTQNKTEVHFNNNAEGRRAAGHFNREWIAAWNEVVKNLAPPAPITN